jgi:amino acid adenylation domain-containing protein
VAATNIEAILPLTPAQEGILFHTLLAPESPLYFQQYTCGLDGPLDPDAFRAAWDVVVGRHQALRSLIAWKGRDRPLQIVRERVRPEWAVEDVRGVDEAEVEARVEAFLDRDRSRGFDLEVAPLMRFALFVGDDRHRFVWSHHHIVVDGWSMGIVLDEVFEAHAAIVAGEPPDLPTPPDHREYVRWLQARDRSRDETHWRGIVGDFTMPTAIGIERRDASESPWAERHLEQAVRLPPDTTERLGRFARSNGLTLGTVLAGAWALVLSRYGPSDDVVFGTTVSGRPPEVDGALGMVGLFINTLPVRVLVDPDAPLVDWLADIQRRQVATGPFESTPLVDVQAWSGVPGGEPLFRSLLVLENVPHPSVGRGPLRASRVRYLQRSNYPLAILVMPGDSLEVVVLHDADRFDPAAIGRLADHFTTVLTSIADHAPTRVAEVGFFPEDEARRIGEWNATAHPFPEDASITDLIEMVVEDGPERPAVLGPSGSLTYGELGRRADAVADALRAAGVGQGDRVVVAMDRSPGAIVAAVGILRADAVYVPVDPTSPPARLESLAAGVSAAATVADDITLVPAGVAGLVVGTTGDLLERLPGPGSTAPPRSAPSGPDDIAYVMHTSGSTGAPKGVAVTHRSLVNSTLARLRAYDEPIGRFLLVSPLFFDSSLAGLFATLTQGGALVLPEPDGEKDLHRLGDLVHDHAVTHLLALPSLHGLILEHVDAARLQSLRLVMVAGEACPPGVVERHRSHLPGVTIANEYGPTEATVWATVHVIPPAATGVVEGRVPIGQPIANMAIHVLDRRGRPTPVGVVGEVHVAGVGLAHGYLGDPASTAERFVVADPWGMGPVRLYRTGDVGRWTANGLLDLLGRMDDQVKVRGRRIEPGEVESVLAEHPAVRSVAVVVVGEGPGARLVAHVEPEVGSDELRAFAAERLPPALVPSVVVAHHDLPRGSTGKIDRSLLADLDVPMPEGRSSRPPSGPVETALAAIWADVLGLEEVGATDDFFDLGGDSLLSIRIMARAHREGLSITPQLFFEHPTIAGLAALVDGD